MEADSEETSVSTNLRNMPEHEMSVRLARKEVNREQTKVQFVEIGIYIVASVAAFIIALLFNKYLLNISDVKEVKWILLRIMYLFYVIAAFALIRVVIIILLLVFYNWLKYRLFWIPIIQKFGFNITLVLSLFLISTIASRTDVQKVKLGELNTATITSSADSTITGTSTSSDINRKIKDDLLFILESNVSNLLYGLFCFFAVFLVKDIIIYLLGYYTYRTHYNNRILENKRRMEIIHELNKVVGITDGTDVNVVCNAIIRAMAENENGIKFEEMRAFIGQDNTEQLYKFIGSRPSDVIDFTELRGFYVSALNEERDLLKSMERNNTSVKNLDFASSVFCIFPAFGLFIMEVLPNNTFGTTSLLSYGSIVFTGGCILSDTIKNMLTSLIFIFFTKPYEIGEIIVVKDQIYRVKEIYIMSSILLSNNQEVCFSHMELSNSTITNISSSREWNVEYKLKFNIQEFKNKREELKARISDHVSKQHKIFKRPVHYKESMLAPNSEILVTLIAYFSFTNTSFRTLQRHREDFTIALYDTLKEVGLVPK